MSPKTKDAPHKAHPLVIVLMGVSGSGKTKVGKRLARELGWSFADGDTFHAKSDIEKMQQGIRLTDQDRYPWLQAIRVYMRDCLENGVSAIVTCSALKQEYRSILTADLSNVVIVYLKGSFELMKERISKRESHFFDQELLRSQFEDLEEPDEALTVDASQDPDEIVEIIKQRLEPIGE